MKDGAQFWEGPQSSGEEDRLENELIKCERELLILKTNFNTLETSYYKALCEIDELKDRIRNLISTNEH